MGKMACARTGPIRTPPRRGGDRAAGAEPPGGRRQCRRGPRRAACRPRHERERGRRAHDPARPVLRVLRQRLTRRGASHRAASHDGVAAGRHGDGTGVARGGGQLGPVPPALGRLPRRRSGGQRHPPGAGEGPLPRPDPPDQLVLRRRPHGRCRPRLGRHRAGGGRVRRLAGRHRSLGTPGRRHAAAVAALPVPRPARRQQLVDALAAPARGLEGRLGHRAVLRRAVRPGLCPVRLVSDDPARRRVVIGCRRGDAGACSVRSASR